MLVPLGALYIDGLTDDVSATTPVLINRIPEPGETGVRVGGSIRLRIVDVGAAGVDTDTEVRVTSLDANGAPQTILALQDDGAAGAFHATYAAGSSLARSMSPGAVVNDQLDITLVRNTAWTSSEVVSVQVDTSVVGGPNVQTTYTFTIQDVVAPYLLSARTRGLRTLRLRFSEGVLATGGTSGDATAARRVRSGITFAASPNRATLPGGAFTAADVGRYLTVIGADDTRGDGVYRITALQSATVVELEAVGKRHLPFAAAVVGPDAVMTVSPYRLESGIGTGFVVGLPDTDADEAALGAHELTIGADTIAPEWFWVDDGDDSTLRAAVRGETQTRSLAFALDASATYTPATLLTAAQTNPGSITLAWVATEPVRIRVDVSAVAVATFLAESAEVLFADETVPAFLPGVEAASQPAAADLETGLLPAAHVDLTLTHEISPLRVYRIGTDVVADLVGNVARTTGKGAAVRPATARGFTTEDVPRVARRRLDLFRDMTPEKNRREDAGHHTLQRFLHVLQEVLDLVAADTDRFGDLLDVDLTPEAALDTLLAHLGNPFSFAFRLSAADKRRLIETLTDMYQVLGTEAGIEAVLLFFFGIAMDVRAFRDEEAFVLDEDLLDVGILGPDAGFALYSFEVVSPVVLTADQRSLTTEIVDFMRPSHTHFVRLVEPS